MKMTAKIRFLSAAMVLAVGFVAVAPTPAPAQIMVTDPASYAYFAKIWTSDLSTGIKMAQTVVQGGQLLQQGLQMYNFVRQEATALQHKEWMQAAGALSMLNFGPAHSNWNLALRSAAGPLYAAGVWTEMTNPNVSVANRIQIADAFGTSMANSLGSCQAAALQNDGAIGQLESVAISADPMNNTYMTMGNLTNMGISQQLRIQQCQHNLQQQQVQGQMLQMMRQRDYDNYQYTTQTNMLSIAASNPRGITDLVSMQTADFQ